MYTLSEITEIWQKTLKKIEKKLNDPKTFDSFFYHTYIDSINNNTVILESNSILGKQLLLTNYRDLIIECLKEVTGEFFEIECVSKNQTGDKKIKKDINDTPHKNIVYFKDAKIEQNLSFENYIVGEFNLNAYKAAHLVAEKPGQKYNPLFIHSNSGLGKTHLLHAIGNYVINHTDKVKVLYTPASMFVDEYIHFATGDSSLQNLKEFFNDVDLFLFDDVQFLAGKVKSQEMFFAIYENLVAKHKQIVIASDRHPNELKDLENRLVTRFQQGLVINIEEPDIDSCVQILKAKIKEDGKNPARFDDNVLTFYAERFSKNVRELEGAINRLIFEVDNLNPNERVTMDVAIKATSHFVGGKIIHTQMTEQKIINAVASYYQLSPNQITGESREAPIARARHVAVYLIYIIMKDVSLKHIGSMFGNKDHSTIKYSVEKIEKELKSNPTLKNSISKIKDNLNSR